MIYASESSIYDSWSLLKVLIVLMSLLFVV